MSNRTVYVLLIVSWLALIAVSFVSVESFEDGSVIVGVAGNKLASVCLSTFCR